MSSAYRQSLEKSIIQTVGYFDIFDYPLTLLELQRFLLDEEGQFGRNWEVKPQLQILLQKLKNIPLVEQARGFYFIRGRRQIILKRLSRYNIAEKKFKKALQAGRLLKLASSIKLIAVCNNLAFSNASEESDIDLFIVSAKNKVWQARFWSLLLLTLFRKRVILPERIQDRIDLNFFVDEEKMNLRALSIDSQENNPDFYLIYWIACLVPIYYQADCWRNFIKNNSWIKNYLPNWYGYQTNLRRLSCSKFRLSIFDQPFKNIQLKIMPQAIKKASKQPDSRVIIADHILKFHLNDRRRQYNELFKKRWRLSKS